MTTSLKLNPCPGTPACGWTTHAKAAARSPASPTKGRCASCRACGRRAAASATTCWCIRRADWSAATRWRSTCMQPATATASSPRRAPRGSTAAKARAGGAGCAHQPGAGRRRGSRWLPLEAICYSGCLAENRLRLQLEPGSELLGVGYLTALGLPQAGNSLSCRAACCSTLSWKAHWLERGRIASDDARLLDGPAGPGRPSLPGDAHLRVRNRTAAGQARRGAGCRARRARGPSAVGSAGATAPGPQVIAVRVLAPLVEPALAAAESRSAPCLATARWRIQFPALMPRGWAI